MRILIFSRSELMSRCLEPCMGWAYSLLCYLLYSFIWGDFDEVINGSFSHVGFGIIQIGVDHLPDLPLRYIHICVIKCIVIVKVSFFRFVWSSTLNFIFLMTRLGNSFIEMFWLGSLDIRNIQRSSLIPHWLLNSLWVEIKYLWFINLFQVFNSSFLIHIPVHITPNLLSGSLCQIQLPIIETGLQVLTQIHWWSHIFE